MVFIGFLLLFSLKGGTYLLPIVEVNLLTTNDLIVLVSLACYEDYVARLS